MYDTYRAEVFYLLERLEKRFKEGGTKIGNPCSMFLPTYVMGILNKVEENGYATREELFDMARIVNVLMLSKSEEVQGLARAILGFIETHCRSDVPDASKIPDDRLAWLNTL